MTTYVLVPGAGGQAWYWHRLLPELGTRGHQAIAVDLPAADDGAGFAEYADAVVAAIGDRRGGLVLVGQSLGGFTVPLVAERVPVDGIVLLNAMVPKPGESAGEWWEATGQAEARAAHAEREGRSADTFDPLVGFFHDVPPEVVAEAMAAGEPEQSGTPFEEPWPLTAWPDVPTRFLQGRDDRFFPLEFQRRVVAERLPGVEVEELPGGHLLALSRPVELAEALGDGSRRSLRSRRGGSG
ncbi:alpha-beta hydrolase superfamily lysophospholipase [Pseudonocardia hierapolitana]|uniref:Alpha-beta hydrolase superfamily lysophospholipase n=1 Tax=Pseudonocardia hierapolitana TaxID=1128676 RepID=A0A561SVH0_9PSEU|nr:alpha/beta fold hydrolase [Pseudonocardia hierapolitana]TWF78869.1 alpha-beta hydrolase superfamily lysophospholipase [Pseudonocardia hierapolitana]